MPPLPAVRSEQADITKELAAIDRDGTLPEIEQDALQIGRRFEHQRTVLAEVNVAHRIDDVGVGGRHQGLGVQPLFPDRQNVVAGAEDLLRAVLHAQVLINGNAQR